MASLYFWILILLVCFDTLHCQYFKWTPSVNGTRNAYCAEHCRDCSVTPCQVEEECCVCGVKSPWEIGLESTLLLHVEYRNAFGDNTLIKPRKPFSDSVLQLIHTNGRMRTFPNNLCNFEKIVHINLQSNSIGKIPNLGCIPYLEVLILSKNQLMEIRNTTFVDNIFLRKVDLSFNPIRVLDPNAFRRYDGSSPFSMQLSHIDIRDLDVTNIFLEGRMFCDIDLSHSSVQNFVNLNNFTVAPDALYGDFGSVNLENSMVKQLPNFTSIGISSTQEFYEKIHFKVLVLNLSLTCDCIFVKYLLKDLTAIKKFFSGTDEGTMICSEPESLRNYTLKDIYDNHLDDMTCDVASNCPPKCHCYEQPSKYHTVINCTESHITHFPETLPWANKYSIIFGENKISSLEKKSYMEKVSYMQVSGIMHMDGQAISSLPNNVVLDLQDHNLQSLPSELFSKDPLKINLGRVLVECVCSSKWLYLWTHFQNTNSTTKYICSNFNKNLELLTTDDFGCKEPIDQTLFIVMIAICVLAVLLILLTLTYCCFYPEMLILTRKFFTKTRPNRKKCDFDVYISLDEEDRIQRKWVITSLLPYLESEGYKVYLPMRDSLPGDNILSERANAIKQSIAYIVILTEKDSMENFQDIDGNETTTVSVIREFEIMWKLFEKDRYRNVIFLDLENIRKKFAKHRIVKAFTRVRHFVKVSSRKKNILREVRSRLHDPFDNTVCYNENVYDFNRNTKFKRNVLQLEQLELPDEIFTIKKTISDFNKKTSFFGK